MFPEVQDGYPEINIRIRKADFFLTECGCTVTALKLNKIFYAGISPLCVKMNIPDTLGRCSFSLKTSFPQRTQSQCGSVHS